MAEEPAQQPQTRAAPAPRQVDSVSAPNDAAQQSQPQADQTQPMAHTQSFHFEDSSEAGGATAVAPQPVREGPAHDVLVVEDDPEINELIGAYVELAGYSCRRVA